MRIAIRNFDPLPARRERVLASRAAITDVVTDFGEPPDARFAARRRRGGPARC